MNSESQFQCTFIESLRLLYPEFVINLSLSGISLNGTHKQNAMTIRQMEREGFVRGIMDLTIYLPRTQTLQLELKTATGRQSADQILIQEQLSKLGHNYYVVRDIDTIYSLIADHTELVDRQFAFNQFTNTLPDTLTEPFLYFPIGTSKADVLSAVQPYYHL